ncbi:ECF sigma factor [Leptospira inadai serovar Lyme str. 10]|uniref:ECF sigma factor n=2 Tax=Leptospira inadai serovar Lyme TaxID=293084 RepID=V6HDC5_9LEPT|nr:RNA polymerase sigma factor [Leptospira inadai]EQA37068.1 ECF sigma factor [Leptospira inadai serovar Lyme str. 10]PNV76572.1 RNA polymerase sigma factor [Leptospira inadai serovar Lyme]
MSEKAKIWETLATRMKKSQEGDSREYELLLRQVRDILRAFLVSRISHIEDREDLLQEILIGIHKAKNSYRPDRPFAPWLFSIARYKTIDHLRKSKKRDRTVLAEMEDFAQIQNPEKEDAWMLAEGIEAWLSVLDERQKEILKMAKIHGYSVREISEKTGLSESNVKVIVHRSVQKIRKVFSGEEGSQTGPGTSK